MQHTDCYTERFNQWCLTKHFFPFTFLSNLSLSDGRSRTFSKPIKSVGRRYLSFIIEGTTVNNRALPTSMTGCIESCGTGDISSSIAGLYVSPLRKEQVDWLVYLTYSPKSPTHIIIGHVNEYPTMHYFGSPRHTLSQWYCIWFWLSISGNSSEKLLTFPIEN